MTAYSAFLRYNELASPRCCDFSFCDTFVKIYVSRPKQMFSYRDGAQGMFCWQNLTLFLALFTCLTDTLVPLISTCPRLYLFSAPCIFIKLLLLIVGVPRV